MLALISTFPTLQTELFAVGVFKEGKLREVICELSLTLNRNSFKEETVTLSRV